MLRLSPKLLFVNLLNKNVATITQIKLTITMTNTIIGIIINLIHRS